MTSPARPLALPVVLVLCLPVVRVGATRLCRLLDQTMLTGLYPKPLRQANANAIIAYHIHARRAQTLL